jgi:two-component system, NarL family, response regulator DesR
MIPRNATTRVLIADRRPVYAAAIKTLLEGADGICATAVEAEPDSVARAASRIAPDVVVCSGEPPRSGSLTAAREVRRCSPSTAILLLMDETRASFTSLAVAAGVNGMVLSSDGPEMFVEAVRAVAGGRTAFGPEFATTASAMQCRLSERELAVLRLAASGLSPHAISMSLGISKSTTRTYLSGAIRKMGAQNRREAAEAAKKIGWL